MGKGCTHAWSDPDIPESKLDLIAEFESDTKSMVIGICYTVITEY